MNSENYTMKESDWYKLLMEYYTIDETTRTNVPHWRTSTASTTSSAPCWDINPATYMTYWRTTASSTRVVTPSFNDWVEIPIDFCFKEITDLKEEDYNPEIDEFMEALGKENHTG